MSLRNARRWLRKQNDLYPDQLAQVPKELWPQKPGGFIDPPVEVWRSKTFLVQVYAPKNGAQRITVNRCEIGHSRLFADGLSWDDLQKVKRELGRGNQWAVELFPSDLCVVNVSNMRHLWLIDTPLYGWK